MNALRRVLYLHAGMWALAGAGLALAPHLVLVTWFGQPSFELAWVRLLGVLAVSLAMVMVLVGHNVEEVWWWSWAFALADLGFAAVVLLNLAFGLSSIQPAGLWWLLGLVSLALTAAMLYGLTQASRERPVPWDAGDEH